MKRTVRCIQKLAVTLSGRFNHAGIQNIDRIPDTNVKRRIRSATTRSTASIQRSAWSILRSVTPVSISAIAKPTARLQRLNSAAPMLRTPATFPTLWLPILRCSRLSPRRSRPALAARQRASCDGARVGFAPTPTNDILFIASQQTGFGYFVNYGKTRRQGAELSLSRNYRWFTLGGNYTFLDATYQSQQVIGSASNSSNDAGLGLDGNITVMPGDQIPQSPRNLLKAYVGFHPMRKLSIDLDFNAVGRSFARGNENNLHQPDGVYYLGPGFLRAGVTNRQRSLSGNQEHYAVLH